MSNIIDKIQLSGVTYDIGGSGSVSTAITSGDTNAVAGGAVYDKFDEVEQVTAQALNVLNESLSGKQDTLSAGTGIDITSNVISVTGSTGGKAVSAGRGISVATGATADTISVSLPISAGTGSNSIVEGQGTAASGQSSHAEGTYTKASGQSSHAEGSSTKAYGTYSHAEGINTRANGSISHAEGDSTQANGEASHAEGHFTNATNESEHASGRYNVSSKANTTFGNSGNTLFSVGNGIDANNRHNAFEIRQNGDIYIVDTSASGDYYDKPMIKLQESLGGTVSSAITSGDTNAVAGGAVYDKFDEVEQVTAQALNVLNESLSGKQDTLSAGTNITIVDNVISAEGGGVDVVQTTGTSTTDVMSQNAVTTQLNNKANKTAAFGSYQFGSSSDGNYIQYKNVKNTDIGNSIYYPKINGKSILTSNNIYARNNYNFELLEKSAVTSAITSSSTDAQVPSAKAVNDKLGGLSLVKLTQAQYDNLQNKDSNTLYVIVN